MSGAVEVVIVVPSFQMGGAEQVSIRLANGLAHAGVRVAMVAIDGQGPLRAAVTPSVDVIDLARRRALAALPALVNAVRRIHPEVVLSSQTHVSVLLVLARRALGHQVRIVAREPGMWAGGPPERLPVRLLRRVGYRRADVVLATSERMRGELERDCRRAVDVLHNPIDVERLRATAADPNRRPGPGRRLLHLGRLAPGKGVSELIEAFATSAAPQDHLTIVGDGPLRAELERTIAAQGLEDRITMAGPTAEPGAWLAGADALIIASFSEGMPNVALEALAVGTPVIATTDLTTLEGLASEAPAGALTLVAREDLADTMSRLPVLGSEARPSLLPADRGTDQVVARLAGLLGLDAREKLEAREGRRDRLRIVIPALSPYPSALAPSVQVTSMAQAFAELGHHVTLIAPTPDAEGQHPEAAEDARALYGFTPTFRPVVLSRRTRRGQSYVNALRIARIVRRARADLVFSRDLRACLLPALRGIPTVFEVHSLSPLEGRQDRWVVGRLLRLEAFRGFVAISAKLAEDMVGAAGIPADRIHVAHDGTRLLEKPVQTPLHDPRVPLKVGYTGSLFAGRGIELLVDIAARSPWLTLHLVGGPEAAVQDWATQLAEREGITNVVLHGLVSPADARLLQQDFDVLVAPFARRVDTDSGVDTSRWMSPMKVFEYMASGRPIVISDLPVLREVLRPDVDALMVEPEDPDALIAALERLRDDPELGARLAASALERVRSEFTWELRARRILARFMPDATGAPGRP
jgi:glycosyltransferase involved in cell wall biosynthesis